MKKHLVPFALSVGLGVTLFLSPNLVSAEEHGHHDHSFSQQDKAAFLDARIASLKTGLKLTPAQEKNWPAVEAAIRDNDKDKQAQIEEWRKAAKEEHHDRDLVEHLHKKAQFLSAHATEINKLADAIKPLFDSLDDSQKHRFAILLHVALHSHGDHHGWGQHEGDHDEHKPDSDDGHHDGK